MAENHSKAFRSAYLVAADRMKLPGHDIQAMVLAERVIKAFLASAKESGFELKPYESGNYADMCEAGAFVIDEDSGHWCDCWDAMYRRAPEFEKT